MSDRDAIARSDWKVVVENAFPTEVDDSTLSELTAILQEGQGDRLQSLHEKSVRQSSEDAFRDDVVQRQDIPNYTRAVLTLLLVRHRLPRYRDATIQNARQVRNYINGNEDTGNGEELYQWLRDGMNLTKEEEEYLSRTTANARSEVNGYENELDGINSVGPSEAGMSTNNAINCLRDFDGRTEPFVRGVLTGVDDGDDVLDIGTGTGALAVTAAIAGAQEVTAIELNPVTALFAGVVVTDLEAAGLLTTDQVTVKWADAMRFGTEVYQDVTQFDAIISENIATGLFFEPQVSLFQHMYDAGLAAAGHTAAVPRGVANYATPVSVSDTYIPSRKAETAYQLRQRGCEIAEAANPVMYSYVDHESPPHPTGVQTAVQQRATCNETIDAVRIHSLIDLGQGGYIGQQENTFLNHDLLLYLDNPVDVDVGETIETYIEYTYGQQTTESAVHVEKPV